MIVAVLDCTLSHIPRARRCRINTHIHTRRHKVLAVSLACKCVEGRKRRKTNREQKAETTAFDWPDRETEINGEKEFHTETHQTAGMSWLLHSTSAISTEREGGLVCLAAIAFKSNTRTIAKENHCEETMNLILKLSVSVRLSCIPPVAFLCLMQKSSIYTFFWSLIKPGYHYHFHHQSSHRNLHSHQSQFICLKAVIGLHILYNLASCSCKLYFPAF